MDARLDAQKKSAVEDFNGTIDGEGVKSVMFKGKTMVELIDPQFIEGIGEVLRFGAAKYAKNNWMRGMSFATVLGGVLRHTLAILRGEEHDPETGLPHAHHAACGLMFIAHYLHGPKSQMYRAFDDREYAKAFEPTPEPPQESLQQAWDRIQGTSPVPTPERAR